MIADPMPLCVRINVAARMIGIGRTKLYELIVNGEVEAIKVGKATLVTTASLLRFPKPAQQGDGWPRKRQNMRLARLHAFGGYRPDSILKIELRPYRKARLVGAGSGVNCKPQCVSAYGWWASASPAMKAETSA